MKTISFWTNDAGDEVTGAEGVNPPEGDSCATLLYSIDAATHEEAMAIHHLRMGWAPYRPLGESAPCPKCEANYYPEGSRECWRCGRIE